MNIKFVKPSIDPFYLLVGILYIINIPWIIILKKDLLKPRLHSAFQLYMDLFIQIAIIHYSGGLNSNSPFVYLPLISIIASAFMVSSRMVVAYSISAAFLYVFVSLIEFYGWLPSFLAGKTTMEINPIDYLYYRIYMHLIIFVGIGYLVSVLNTRIRFQLDEVAKYRHLSDIILYQIKSGLITISNSEKIIYSNQAASEILGYAREELLEETGSTCL